MKSLLTSNNADYHANRSHLSSSSLKMVLKDIRRFKAENIDGFKPAEKENPAFVEGSLLHTLILEPHLISQYAIYPGLRKQGAMWEEFKAKNADKICISAPQMLRAEKWHGAYAALEAATQLISGGFAEHTILGSILGVDIKTRPDYINVEKGYIVDVKTTSMPSDPEIFKQTVAEYCYELSAALYCQVAFSNFNKIFDFYWVVVSKADNGCEVYKASASTLAQGQAMYTQAIVKYKKCLASGVWEDTLTQEDKAKLRTAYEVLEI